MGDLEAALARTESDAVASARAADNASKATKRLVAASKVGDLASVEKALNETEKAIQALLQQFNNTRDGWSFDAAAYAQEGRLAEELRVTAQSEGLSVYEQDGRLFSYPVLIRVLPAKTNAELSIEIDKKKTRAVRPSYVARELVRRRDRPLRFNPRVFLDAIYKAYLSETKEARQSALGAIGPSVSLYRIYDILTLFPGLSQEYGRQEFARDLYLLDRSGLRTAAGAEMVISPPRGANVPRQFRMVDERGREQAYYSVAFTRG